MPADATLQEWFVTACAIGFLVWCAVFAVLARKIREQYVRASAPMTPLARALYRQKAALAVFGLAFFLVFGTAAGISILDWELGGPWRNVYRVVAVCSILGVPLEAWRVVRAMDTDARNILRDARADAHRQMLATERIADQGDAAARWRGKG
jgi:heme O synthase-like polyprenyltransferase